MSTIRATDEAIDELRRAVFERYNQLRGRLKDEASEALRRHAEQLRTGTERE